MGIIKLVLATVGLSYTGSQLLLVYHLKMAPYKDPITMVSEDAIPVSLRESRKDIVDAVLALYQGNYSTSAIMKYAANASFDDPAVSLEGRKLLGAAFSSMPRFFSKMENHGYKVMHGKDLIAIDVLNQYQVRLLGLTFTLPSVIYLKVEGPQGEEQIKMHTEEWYGKPLLGKEATYFVNVGYVAMAYRKLHGKLTGLLCPVPEDLK